MSANQIVLYCGLLLTVMAFSIDITLPAFSRMAADLDEPYAAIQLVIPVFIVTAGFGQIFAGPLSDRFGRRPVIIAGLVLLAAGSVVCAMAASAETLLAGRAVQGFGAAAGPVIARAMLRDLFSGDRLAHNIALATMVFAFGPIVAPLVGVGFMAFATWRVIFWVILGFGLILLALALWALPETNRNPSAAAIRLTALADNTKRVFGNSQSRFYLLMSGVIMSMMITVLVSLPRVFEEAFGVTGALFAVLFALHGFGIIAGQVANRRMIRTMGTARAMASGAVVLVGATLSMLGLDLAGYATAYTMAALMVVFATSYLIVYANAIALCLDPHGDIAGFASSLIGFVSQFVSAALAVLIAWIVGGDLTTFILVLLFLTVFVSLTLSLHLRKIIA